MWRELKPSVTLCAYQGATLQNRPLGWPFVSVCAPRDTHKMVVHKPLPLRIRRMALSGNLKMLHVNSYREIVDSS